MGDFLKHKICHMVQQPRKINMRSRPTRHIVTAFISVSLLVIVFSGTSCKKKYITDDVPMPVRRSIEKFEKSSSCRDAHVDEFTFQQKDVYVFDEGTCGADMISVVLNEQGEKIGTLGGFTGNTQVNGESFANATFIRTIWKKTP
jgi:hypothetical protein